MTLLQDARCYASVPIELTHIEFGLTVRFACRILLGMPLRDTVIPQLVSMRLPNRVHPASPLRRSV